jgi:hypothetical protein
MSPPAPDRLDDFMVNLGHTVSILLGVWVALVITWMVDGHRPYGGQWACFGAGFLVCRFLWYCTTPASRVAR